MVGNDEGAQAPVMRAKLANGLLARHPLACFPVSARKESLGVPAPLRLIETPPENQISCCLKSNPTPTELPCRNNSSRKIRSGN